MTPAWWRDWTRFPLGERRGTAHGGTGEQFTYSRCASDFAVEARCGGSARAGHSIVEAAAPIPCSPRRHRSSVCEVVR